MGANGVRKNFEDIAKYIKLLSTAKFIEKMNLG